VVLKFVIGGDFKNCEFYKMGMALWVRARRSH